MVRKPKPEHREKSVPAILDRSGVERLRSAVKNGGFVHVGRGGWDYSRQDTLSGAGGVGDCVPQAAIRVGIPVVDTTAIPDRQITKVLRCPLPEPGRRDAYFSCAKRLGAKTHNWRPGR